MGGRSPILARGGISKMERTRGRLVLDWGGLRKMERIRGRPVLDWGRLSSPCPIVATPAEGLSLQTTIEVYCPQNWENISIVGESTHR